MRWILTVVVCLSGVVMAQESPKGDPPADVLAGPRVGGEAGRVTPDALVERDFDGKVRRLDMTPEEAALALMDLTPEEKASVEAILGTRAAAIDALVRANLQTIQDAANAGQSGDRAGQARAVRALLGQAKELGEKGRLRDQLVRVLDPEKADQLRMMTDAYWKAVVDESEKGEGAGKGSRGRAMTKEFLLAMGQEIRRSYERSIASKGKELDAALATLNLSDEKATRVKNLFTDYGQKNLLNKATPEDRRAFIQALARELGPADFRALIQEVFGAGRMRTPGTATKERG